jgi:hypothetical protein
VTVETAGDPSQVARAEAAASWYRPGAISRFYDWVDGLPWHGWWLYPALAVALFACGHAILWSTGRLPLGTIEPTLTVSVVYGPYALGALAYANLVAKRALTAFWPATGWPNEERPSWALAFTTIRAGLGIPSLAFGIIIAIAAFLSAPAAVVGLDDPSRLIYFVALLPVAVFGYAMTLLVLAHTTRQLRLVSRIHRQAEAIDPFDRIPVYAFSRFTAQIGLMYLIGGYYTLTVNSAFQAGNIIGLGVLALVIGFGAACFILPLWGIHGRLVDEKEALLVDVEARMRKLDGELYRRIDAGEFDGTKVISEGIAGAGAIRERIANLPTWPWPRQVFRGFVSALLLPLILYVLSRVIAGQFGG